VASSQPSDVPRPSLPAEDPRNYLRETVSGKTVYLYVPRQIRSFAIDYLRSLGARVIDRGRSDFELHTTIRWETVGDQRARGRKTIVEAELKAIRKDGSREIVLLGRAEGVHDGRDESRATALVGQRALLDLNNPPRPLAAAPRGAEQPAPDATPGRYTFHVPEEIRGLLALKAVSLDVPRDVRALALDYIRDAGGVVVEGSSATQWKLGARARTERLPHGALREKVIIDVELAYRGTDHSWKMVMRGQGEAPHASSGRSEAIAVAARQALERLSK
jgi:hypothetical protein